MASRLGEAGIRSRTNWTHVRKAAGLGVLGVLIVGTGCPSSSQFIVPSQDVTPPSAIWLQADIPGRPLANTTLGGNPVRAEMAVTDVVSISARADDPDGGIKRLEIWFTITRNRPGVQEGPSLAGAPTAEFVSSATVGQAASPSANTHTKFDIGSLIGSFDEITLEVFARTENFHGGRAETARLLLHARRSP